MIIKLPNSTLPRRILTRIHLIAYSSSLPQPNFIQITPQNDQTPSNSSEFEAKIESLKNKLHPETLIHVLSSTHDLNSSLKLFKWASLQGKFRHTSDTYYHMIMKLGLASRIDEMEGFCNEMMKGGFSASEQALLGLLDSFIRHRKLDEASRVLFILNSFGYNPSIDSINRLLGVLVEEKKGFQSVLFVYKEMVKANVVPTTETLNHLLEALFDADRIDSVLDQYRRMQKKGCCPNSRTHEIIVSGLIGKNRLDESLLVLNEILESGCDLESNFFSRTLPLLFRINEPELGLRLFEKMKACNVLIQDSSIYEVLIHYFTKNLCMNDALNLLDEMINIDLKPPDYVFFDLVNGFCSLNKLSDAESFLEDRKVMDSDSYNVLLEGYCNAGKFVDLIRVFKQLLDYNITNKVSWNMMIRYLSEIGRTDLVYKALGRMIVSGSMPDSFTYSALIIGKCKSKELDGALDLFHRVSEQSWVVDSSCYAILIGSLCDSGQIPAAAAVFRLAYRSGRSFSDADYNIIIKSVLKSSRPNRNWVAVILARMVIEGCRLDSEAYNEVIKHTIKSRKSKECAFFVNRMIEEGLIPDPQILTDSISFLAGDFRLHMVFPAIGKLFSGHETVNPAIYNTMVNGLWKEGYKVEARGLLDLIVENGWVPDLGTHGLLIGSGSSEVAACEKGEMEVIIGILSEGLGEV